MKNLKKMISTAFVLSLIGGVTCYGMGYNDDHKPLVRVGGFYNGHWEKKSTPPARQNIYRPEAFPKEVDSLVETIIFKIQDESVKNSIITMYQETHNTARVHTPWQNKVIDFALDLKIHKLISKKDLDDLLKLLGFKIIEENMPDGGIKISIVPIEN